MFTGLECESCEKDTRHLQVAVRYLDGVREKKMRCMSCQDEAWWEANHVEQQ